MPEVDSLDVKIAASAENAIKSLDTLIGKLNTVTGALKFDTSGIKNIGASMKSVESTLNGVEKKVEKVTKNMRDEFMNVTKDIGKGYRYEGTFEGVQKQLSKYTNALKNAKIRVQELEAAGRTSGGEYLRAISNLNKYQNMVNELSEQLKKMTLPTQTEDEILKMAQNATKTKDAIRETAEETQRYGETISNAAYAGRNIVEEVEKISQTTANTQKAASGFKMPFISSALTDTAKSAQKLSDIFKNLKVDNAADGLQKIDDSIKKVKEQYRQLGEQIRIAFEHNKNYGNTAAFDRQQIKIEQLQNQYRDLILMQRRLSQEQPYERIGMALKGVGKAASGALNTLRSYASRLKDVVKNSIKAHSTSKQLQNATKTLTKNLLKVSNMLKMMLVRMALRKVIEGVGTGFKGLALYSDEFNRSLSMLINSLKQLGYSVSAAVSPLVNAFAPALNQIIQLAIKAVNYINQLLSALTGKGTWIRAKKQTESYADSLKKAGSAAKGALRSFDELKVISTSSGGGGTDDINPSDMFETVDIDSKILELADMIKAAWEKADFTELGTMFGEKIKEGLDKINWESIQDTAKRLGSSIGTFITGFVSTPDLGKRIGETIAETINTGIYFATSLLDNTDFIAIGTFIYESINGFIDRIDADEIAHLLASALNAIFDTLRTIGEGIDWENLGEKVGGGVNTFTEEFDAKGAADTIDAWVHGIEKAIKKAATTIDWGDVFGGIKDFFTNLDIDTVDLIVGAITIKKVGSWILSGGALKALSGAFSGAIGEVGLGTFLFGDIGEIAASASLATVGATIGAVVIGGITAAIGGWFGGQKLWEIITGEDIGMSFSEQMSEIFSSFTDGSAGEALKLWGQDIAEAFSEIGGKIKEPFDGISSWMDTNVFNPISMMASDLWKNIKDTWDKTKSWFSDNVTTPISTLFSGVTTRINQFFQGSWIIVKGTWQIASNWFNTNVIQPVSTFFSNLTNSIGQFFSDVWNNKIVPLWNTVSGWFNRNVIVPVKTYFSALTTSIGTFFSNAWNRIKNIWNGVTNWFNVTILIPLKTNFNSIVNSIGGFFSKLWTDIQNGAKFAANGIIGFFERAINGIIDNINGFLDMFNSAGKFMAKITEDSWGGVDLIHHISIPTFAQGGFPEDGWFRASGNELIGKWDNGQSVVSTNSQIISGIAEGIYPAVYSAVSSALQNNRDLLGSGDTKVYVGTREITDVVIDNIADRTTKNQKTPFPIMV